MELLHNNLYSTNLSPGHSHDVSVIWEIWPLRVIVWWPLRTILDLVFFPLMILFSFPIAFWNFIPTTIETVAYSATLPPLIWGIFTNICWIIFLVTSVYGIYYGAVTLAGLKPISFFTHQEG